MKIQAKAEESEIIYIGLEITCQQPVLTDQFREGFAEELRDEIMRQGIPNHFEELF